MFAVRQDGFDYAWLLTWLDRPDVPWSLTQAQYLLRREGLQMGIFATRSQRWPNPIGLISGCGGVNRGCAAGSRAGGWSVRRPQDR
ncbi:hypothetical protein [Amycolatopsis sp. cmx-4-61]|uniref:hypothetical protein n=1 Tax=Amycolatopsis sp. cmx-4-61 TaxID=2790937 RepID=UPI00397C367B